MPAGQLAIGVHSGVPHAFGVPAPPQTCPAGQLVPQSRVPPHPSAILAQAAPWHARGMHWPPSAPTTPLPHTLETPPPPQVCADVHGLQYAVTPSQPSGCGPQRPGYAAHVFGTHVPPSGWLPPHLLGPPPPQKSGALHVPHDSTAPHPSLCCPQSTPLAL